MTKLTGKLLEIARKKTLMALTDEDNDSRFSFWTEKDSENQLKQELAEAVIIDTVEGLEQLDKVLNLDTCKHVGIDIESEGLEYWKYDVLGVGLACMICSPLLLPDALRGDCGYTIDECFHFFYVNLNLYPGENLPLIEAFTLILRRHLDKTFYLHNSKFDQHWFKQKLGFYLPKTHDSMVMTYVLGEKDKALDKLSAIYLSRFPHTLKGYLGKEKITREDMLSIPTRWLADYCVEDCVEGVLLSFLFMERLQLEPVTHQQPGFFSLWDVYERIDLYCIHSLNWAENVGCLIDWDKLSHVGETIKSELFGIECEIAEIINVPLEEARKIASSPRELSDCLFKKLQLPSLGLKPTKYGYSTDVVTLNTLKDVHPLPKAILDHRKLSKINGTYVNGFYERSREDRLHSTFNNCLTDTGRLSSSDPNLQNIPNPSLSPTGKLLRQCFIADEGNVLVKADYSQFELRILAHFSQDKYLIECYRNGLDVHSTVACLLFDHKYENFDPKNNPIHELERRLTKTINFGLIYGMTKFRLYSEAQKAKLNYSLDHCDKIMAKYWSMLPGVTNWMAYTKLKAIRDGYTETIFGRRRYFNFQHPYLRALREKAKDMDLTVDNLTSLERQGFLNNPKDAEALRAAGNAPIQGSNADAIRLVMGVLYDEYYGSEVNLILNVHDEILLECPWQLQEEVSSRLVHIMKSVIELSVPVEVDPKCALSWGDT